MSQELTELQQQIVRFYHHNPFVEYLHIQVQPKRLISSFNSSISNSMFTSNISILYYLKQKKKNMIY